MTTDNGGKGEDPKKKFRVIQGGAKARPVKPTRLGFVEERYLQSAASDEHGVPFVDLSEIEIDPEVIATIPKDLAEKYTVLPVNKVGKTLVIAMYDPTNVYAIDELHFWTGLTIEVVVATREAIVAAIRLYYGKNG
jgi:type IV pilus assembly protein PilB